MAPLAAKQKRKVFLVDDHPLVREWLAILINQQQDLEICGEAGDAAQTLELIAKVKPDIAVVDISLEGGSGLELIKDITAVQPNIAVIVLSMHDEFLYAERALRAGARGYVMKREASTKVLQGVRGVLEGKLFLSDKISRQLAEKKNKGQAGAAQLPVGLLSNRELQVFQLLGLGRTTRQIADELQVGFKTVQTYCMRIKLELGLENHTELMRTAVRWNDRQLSQSSEVRQGGFKARGFLKKQAGPR